MTSDAFRKLALRLPEAIEGSHMAHPDFRVGNRIFASIHPDGARGMVKLTPEQQQVLMKAEPAVFHPAAGQWGVRGATMVTFRKARAALVKQALLLAWRNTAPGRLLKEMDAE